MFNIFTIHNVYANCKSRKCGMDNIRDAKKKIKIETQLAVTLRNTTLLLGCRSWKATPQKPLYPEQGTFTYRLNNNPAWDDICLQAKGTTRRKRISPRRDGRCAVIKRGWKTFGEGSIAGVSTATSCSSLVYASKTMVCTLYCSRCAYTSKFSKELCIEVTR